MTKEQVDKIVCGWTIQFGVPLTEKQLNSLVDLIHDDEDPVFMLNRAVKDAIWADCMRAKLNRLENLISEIDSFNGPCHCDLDSNYECGGCYHKRIVNNFKIREKNK